MSYKKYFEYENACNPTLNKNTIYSTNINDYNDGIHFINQQDKLNINNYACTSAELLAGFIVLDNENTIKINKNENFNITSMIMFIYFGSINFSIEKNNKIVNENVEIRDLIVITDFDELTINKLDNNKVKIFFVNDSPLLNYLNVSSTKQELKLFEIYKHDEWKNKLEELSNPNNNRKGILLANKITEEIGIKTITKTLWTLINEVPVCFNQNPHRHNSIAFDFVIDCDNDKSYTLISDELNKDDNNIDKLNNPQKIKWKSGEFFITPINLWHSHHNESSDKVGLILPIQNAGLLSYLRTFDIDLYKV